MLEWFIQWANALFLVNDSVPLSAVEWQSMTTADFDSYRTSMGTYTPIIRASRMKSPDCTTLADARAAKMPSPDCATPADAELCTPTSTSAYRLNDLRMMVDCYSVPATLAFPATINLAPRCNALLVTSSPQHWPAAISVPDHTVLADDDPLSPAPVDTDDEQPYRAAMHADPLSHAKTRAVDCLEQHACTIRLAGDTHVLTYYAPTSPAMVCVMMSHADDAPNPSAGCI